MNVGVINYGMGNIRSIVNACELLGASVSVLETPEKIDSVSSIILPGVGAFGDGMKKLTEGNWLPALNKHVKDGGKPFMGICLGMQLLAEKGTEHAITEGLGWVSGTVEKLEGSADARIPHIGWNNVSIKKDSGIFSAVNDQDCFYFVHSFALKDLSKNYISSTCTHAEEFISSIEVDNIYGVQFHPEKSQKTGLAILKKFLETA